MKIPLNSTFIGLDKQPIYNGQTYAIAELIKEDGKPDIIKPIYVDEGETKSPYLSTKGEKITLRDKLADYLLSENKESPKAKAALGWKILMAENEDVEFSKSDIEMIEKVVVEKEKIGLFLHQVLTKLPKIE